MEGEPGEESDEDGQGEDKPVVLWEKCIQQSIFVDLSEDESLHLSDLESSLALRLSQAESTASERSVHLSGSAELSALEETTSESSIASSQSEEVLKSRSSMLHVPAQRPNALQDEEQVHQGYEDQGQSTSDEDQDDLPYDGDLGSPYFNQTAYSEGNASSEGRGTVIASPDVPCCLECNTKDGGDEIGHSFLAEKPANLLQQVPDESLLDASKPGDFAPSCLNPAGFNQLLLRHFSREELLQPGRLIEAETLPEVSLLESVDDTVLSQVPICNSTTSNSNHSEMDVCSEKNRSFCSKTDEKSITASTSSENKAEEVIATSTNSNTSISASNNSKQESGETVEETEEDNQMQRVPLVRTRSFSEMKYGQGQVHYRLPDFSKVAPKVKIPKASSGPVRAVPQSPGTMHRAQSSPGMLDVVSRVLEDSVPPPEKPYVFKDEDKQTPPALAHHLQAEYDKLLTKFAEAENLIDQMRLENNTQPCSELMLDCDVDHKGNLHEVGGSHFGSSCPNLATSENDVEKAETIPLSNNQEVKTKFSIQPDVSPSDGDIMTAELRDIVSHFMEKVEELKLSVRNMSLSKEEQQIMLRSIIESQDLLERKYISKKEEHRALEMQNYMGLSRNTGIFDPNRLVEGDIFRIGMHLEDIKEMIDKNVCEQISPPHSSSTPTPMKEILHRELSPLCILTLSPPLLLHEGPTAGVSTADHKTGPWEGEEMEDASEVHEDDGSKLSEKNATESSLKNTGRSSCLSMSSQGFLLEGLESQTPEAEDERSSVFSEAIDHSNILAYFSGARSPSRLRQSTPESCNTPESLLNAAGECDQGDGASLAVEVSSSSGAPEDLHSPTEPPTKTSSVSQRIVSPETDSGFGSSYLNQSASGSLQPNLPAERLQSQNDGLSESDSEASCSNLQTAIHSSSLSSQRWASPHPSISTQPGGAAAAVERWVESTTQEPSGMLPGSGGSRPAMLHHHASEPTLRASMETEERGSPLYPCSCNSEAIQALQSEVSRLKKDLEEGLVQLPQLTQKMDYLTSKCRQERQERRLKSRTRTHQRAVSSSVLKPSSSRENLSSSQVRIEDWISLDIDHSKSRGTDSGDTADSDMMLELDSSPVEGRRGSSLHTTTEYQFILQSNRDSGGASSVKTSGLSSYVSKGGREEALKSSTKQKQHTLMDSYYSKNRWSLFSSPVLQKPLLQVGYGSSSSLPASYKVREPPLQSSHRKRSTQSDTALLPSNVYFQRTPSPATAPSKTGSRRGRRRGSKEEEMNRTLDQALEVARSLKRQTDRMARRLSADLAKTQLHRRPLGGRKHHAL